jgi:hypothetical protein
MTESNSDEKICPFSLNSSENAYHCNDGKIGYYASGNPAIPLLCRAWVPETRTRGQQGVASPFANGYQVTPGYCALIFPAGINSVFEPDSDV